MFDILRGLINAKCIVVLSVPLRHNILCSHLDIICNRTPSRLDTSKNTNHAKFTIDDCRNHFICSIQVFALNFMSPTDDPLASFLLSAISPFIGYFNLLRNLFSFSITSSAAASNDDSNDVVFVNVLINFPESIN